MKCPNCGREIPDGGLICEYCAQEIHIVPEYDTRVEETISETMSAIQSEIKKDEKSGATVLRVHIEDKEGLITRTDWDVLVEPWADGAEHALPLKVLQFYSVN